jgi:hypothetical protein
VFRRAEPRVDSVSVLLGLIVIMVPILVELPPITNWEAQASPEKRSKRKKPAPRNTSLIPRIVLPPLTAFLEYTLISQLSQKARHCNFNFQAFAGIPMPAQGLLFMK